MRDSDNPLRYNPFEALETLLKDKVILRPVPIKKTFSRTAEPCPAPVNEENAFQEAMADVKPMVKNKHHNQKPRAAKPASSPCHEPQPDGRQQLEKLVRYGEGFIIAQTPEYMEGTGRDIPPEFAERLHRGDFSIQAHLDLHGMSMVQAKEAFENFLIEAIGSGKGAVLIIHGRGISSAGEPVLKNKLSEWLTRSHWRKRVIAFASAKSYDGGAGATYVLLRHRLPQKRAKKSR